MYTDFTDAAFLNTNLSKVDFTYAEKFNIDIKNNILEGAKFNRYEAVRLLSGFGIDFVD